MADNARRDWLAEAGSHAMTCVCERALRAASGVTWQRLARIAAGQLDAVGADHFDPTRAIVAEYLRHTGRLAEAAEVEALGCNEPPPPTSFARLDTERLQQLRESMRG